MVLLIVLSVRTTQKRARSERNFIHSDRLHKNIYSAKRVVLKRFSCRSMADHKGIDPATTHEGDLINQNIAQCAQFSPVTQTLHQETRTGIASPVGKGGKFNSN